MKIMVLGFSSTSRVFYDQERSIFPPPYYRRIADRKQRGAILKPNGTL